MRPATQMVVATDWLGTSRAIQEIREGVTDLGFDVASISSRNVVVIIAIVAIVIIAVSKLGNIDISPSILGPGWRKRGTSIDKETPSHLIETHFVRIQPNKVSTFGNKQQIIAELVHEINATLYPAKEGKYGGSVCELSRCERGEEDTPIVLQQELWNKMRVNTKKK